MRLGAYLRTLRLEKGWTQAVAGEVVGVDAVTIRRWELGLFSPSSNRIEQVADAFGVDVSDLIDAAEAGEQDEQNSVIPIKGYLEAGTAPESSGDDLGTISLPSPMIQEELNSYFLAVSGDSLVPDGIHDGDVLLVYPDQQPRFGHICVMEKGDSVYAGTYVNEGSLRIRTATGAMVDVDFTSDQLVGTVAWHVRRI